MLNATKTHIHAIFVRSLMLSAFDPGKNCWKLTADGKAIELKDGKPIWIDANGGEVTLDGDAIARLNGEARDLRKAKETAEAALVPFKDLDPAVARKAIADIAKIDSKKLIDAGQVDVVKAEITAQFTGQMEELKKQNGELQTSYDGLLVDNIFAQSQFIRDSVAVPADMFQATFRSNFKKNPDTKKLEAYDKSGNRIMSKTNFGEPATAEEALSILVDQHPNKTTILKASGNSGSGNNGNGGNRTGMRVVKRNDFDAMPPHEQAATAALARGPTATVTIVD